MNRKKTIWSGITGVLASVLAFWGVVSCCGMPIIAGILATLGIGASQLSFFAEYKGWFIVFAVISLIYRHTSWKRAAAVLKPPLSKRRKAMVSLPKYFYGLALLSLF